MVSHVGNADIVLYMLFSYRLIAIGLYANM
jgi:hypothetical protein